VVIDPVLMGVITALAGAVGTLASLVYREIKQQVTDCRAENLTLRAEAKETVKAQKDETAEWKRLALTQKTGSSQ
jgi:hypothetical protein